MNLDIIKDILNPFIEEHNLKFISSELVKEDGNLFLRVIIDNPEGLIDIDTLALANEYLSERIDEYDKDLPEYYLEVSSPGAERVLKTKEDIINSIDKYVHIEVENMIYEGFLLEVNDQDLVIRINMKGRFKNIKVDLSTIKLIRLAVKF